MIVFMLSEYLKGNGGCEIKVKAIGAMRVKAGEQEGRRLRSEFSSNADFQSE